MPYKAFLQGDTWSVFTVDENDNPVGEAHGRHDTEEAAQAQVRALYASVREMTDAEKRRVDDVYKRYHDTVNMSASELEAWADTDFSKAASLDRSPITRNLRLLRTPKDEWTLADVRDANRTISFVSRMRGTPQGDDVSEGIPYSKRDISLKNWAFDPGKVSEMYDDQMRYTQDAVNYTTRSAVSGERCGNCAHWKDGRCAVVVAEPLPIVEDGWCEAHLAETDMVSETEKQQRAVVQEVRTFEFPTNGIPSVKTYPDVDVALLTRGDDDPFYIVLPIARVGEVSGNGLYYDETLVQAIAEQLKGLGGIRGHIPYDHRSTAYPLSDVHWVGHQRTGDTLWAKGYIPPGDTREDIRRIKARRGKLSTSIYGSGIPVVGEDGYRRLKQPVLEQVDLAPTSRAAVKLDDGEFAIVSEMTKNEGTMEDKDMKATLAEMDTASIYEMIPTAKLAELVEMYMKKSGKRVVAAEMADTIVSQQLRVSELQQQYALVTDALAQRNTEIDELRQREFVRAADAVVAELINWQADSDAGKQRVMSLRNSLRQRVMGKMTTRDLDVFREQAIAEMQNPEFRVIAETVRDTMAGASSFAQPNQSSKPSAREQGQMLDPEFTRRAADYFGF